ncbi:MAG: EamA/RhaT family transporter [Sphingomonadales bacterium]|nr:EamA/RhaT family transporter [Sphingomonadales bacterium]
MTASLLWVPFTLAGSVAQIVRNSAQASLTARIGTLGATQTRFVFGLPFALLYLAALLAFSGASFPHFSRAALGWTVLAGLSQIAATAMMLVVMGRRAFAVAYAYIKTEPVIVAIAGTLLLGDALPPLAWLAVVVVTAGVLVASVKPDDWRRLLGEGGMILAGLVSGGLFGLSSIAARGAANALGQGPVMVRALSVLAVSLVMQTALLGLWLLLFDRRAFLGSLREWRTSIGAGCAGATASACFFTAFALAPAANSRTLTLVELPLAALVSRYGHGRVLKRHEIAGLAVIMAGVALLLTAHA